MARLRDEWSERRALDLILAGEQPEFLKYFPEYRGALHQVEARVRRVTNAVDTEYRRIRDLEDQRMFAAEATQSPYRQVLFKLRERGNLDAYSWLLRLSESRRLQFLAQAGEVFSDEVAEVKED